MREREKERDNKGISVKKENKRERKIEQGMNKREKEEIYEREMERWRDIVTKMNT